MDKEFNSKYGNWEFYKGALAIGVPVMLQSLLQSLVNLIDSFMVSGLGDIKMSGVNISGQILFVFMVLMNSICMSGGIFLTQFFGANDKDGMKQCFAFKLITTLIMGGLYLYVTFGIPRQVISLMVIGNSQAKEILEFGQQYMRLMGFAGFQMSISAIIASSYREIGKVKIPLVITVSAALLNSFLNWVLIYGHYGMPRFEVKGAAYATIITRTIEMLVYIVFILYDKPDFIGFSVFNKINWKLFRTIIKKGSLLVISQMMWVLSESLTVAVYNSRGGANVVSGMAASFSIANLFFVAFDGINTATGVIIGKSLGSNNLDRALVEKKWMLFGAKVFGVFMTLLGFATVGLVPVVFGRLSLEAQTITKHMVMIIALFMPLWTYVNAQMAISKAGGDTKVCMLVDGGITLVMIPLLLIMGTFTTWSPIIMYVVVKMLDIIKIILAGHELKKNRWVVNLSC